MEPLLEVKKLTKTFQKKGQEELAAVDHVSFCLLPGETLGIVGESGSGKSTVARMITRAFEALGGGDLSWGQSGHSSEVPGGSARYTGSCRWSFSLRRNPLTPRRTLGDGVGESLKNTGLSSKERKRRVEKLFMQCGLPARLCRPLSP